MPAAELEPVTDYALVRGDHVAFQVLGDGPTTLVPCTGINSSVDAR